MKTCFRTLKIYQFPFDFKSKIQSFCMAPKNPILLTIEVNLKSYKPLESLSEIEFDSKKINSMFSSRNYKPFHDKLLYKLYRINLPIDYSL